MNACLQRRFRIRSAIWRCHIRLTWTCNTGSPSNLLAWESATLLFFCIFRANVKSWTNFANLQILLLPKTTLDNVSLLTKSSKRKKVKRTKRKKIREKSGKKFGKKKKEKKSGTKNAWHFFSIQQSVFLVGRMDKRTNGKPHIISNHKNGRKKIINNFHSGRQRGKRFHRTISTVCGRFSVAVPLCGRSESMATTAGILGAVGASGVAGYPARKPPLLHSQRFHFGGLCRRSQISAWRWL